MFPSISAGIRRFASLFAIAFVFGACLSPNSPAPRRFFQPELPAPVPHTSSPARIGFLRYTAAPYLGPNFVWRLSRVELAIDDDHRWIAEPALLVESAVDRLLLGTGRIVEVPESRDLPYVRIHVDAFEGHLDGRPAALVRLLAESEGPTTTRVIEASVEIAQRSPEALASGIGAALTEALDELGTWLEGLGPDGSAAD